MKKTDRKNNTNQVVTYPSGIFTTEELHNINSHMKLITLRKRVVKDTNVHDIGYLHNNKGRPRTVYVHGVITDAFIESAKEKGIVLKSDLMIDVASVNQTTTIEPTVSIKTTVSTQTVSA